jgi:hypothetical protein
MPTENLEHCNSGHLCLSLPKNLDASLLIPARIANQNNGRYEFLHSKRVLKVRKSTLARQPNWGATNERSRLIQPRFLYVMENRTCPPQSPRSGPPAPEKHSEPVSLTTRRRSRGTRAFERNHVPSTSPSPTAPRSPPPRRAAMDRSRSCGDSPVAMVPRVLCRGRRRQSERRSAVWPAPGAFRGVRADHAGRGSDACAAGRREEGRLASPLSPPARRGKTYHGRHSESARTAAAAKGTAHFLQVIECARPDSAL